MPPPLSPSPHPHHPPSPSPHPPSPPTIGTKQSAQYQLLSSSASRPRQRLNFYVITCALLASMNSILLGYDTGVISGALLFIKEDLELQELQEEVLVSSLSIVSLAGAAAAGRISDAIGRRWTMALAAFIFLIGAAVMGLAPSFAVLLVGRLSAGIGVGFALMIAPVYTAELSPASNRGSLVSLPEIFINLGILLGYVSNYALSGLPLSIGWRVMLGLGTIPAVMLGLGVLIMPESPRWLVMQNRIHEAKIVLIRTSENAAEADKRLLDIMEVAGLTDAYTAEKLGDSSLNLAEIVTPDVHRRKSNDGNGVWKELLWPSPPVRRMLTVAIGVHFFQQATGIDAIVYYSPEVFKDAGMESKSGVIAATVAVGFIKTLFILVATLLLDRVGRRPLLLVSTIGITASLLSLASGFMILQPHRISNDSLPAETLEIPRSAAVMAIIAVCFFVAFFSIGMGPICWVMTTEIFPLRLRAQATSLGIVVNRTASGLVSLTFLSISKAISLAGTYFLFGGVSLVSVVFVYFCTPETKGKTLEEVGKFFYRDDSERLPMVSGLELSQGSFIGEERQLDSPETHLNGFSRANVEEDDEMLGWSDRRSVFENAASRHKLLAKVKSIAKQGVDYDTSMQ